MKIITAFTALSAFAINGFSQGQISFQNALTSQFYFNGTANPANKVTAGTVGSQESDSASTGVIEVGLYWSTAPFTDAAQGTLADVVTMSSTTPGTIAGGTVILPGTTGGENVYVQVFAWDSTYANPDAARAVGGAFGASSAGPNNTTYGAIGAAQLVTALTVSPGPPNPVFGTGAGQFQRCVLYGGAPYIPEPGTLALGAAGAAAFLLLRRRK